MRNKPSPADIDLAINQAKHGGWIDPTDEYARLRQLPRSDQGRLALIARAESTELVAIPEASSQDNRVVEKREFYLAENGPARVIETTEPHGVFESARCIAATKS